MASRAVSILKVDEALASRYSGITIDVGGTPTPVEIFMENPMPEEVTERVYPSVAINLIGVFENTEVLDSDDDGSEEVGYDTGVVPYERHMRERPIPSRLVYSITAWHRIRVVEARNLLYEALVRRTRPKDYLTIENIDGVDVDLWTFWSGGTSLDKEADNDFMIYRSTVSLDVHADISPVVFDEYVSAKVAMEILWDVYSRKWVSTGQGISIVPGGDVLDVRTRDTV